MEPEQVPNSELNGSLWKFAGHRAMIRQTLDKNYCTVVVLTVERENDAGLVGPTSIDMGCAPLPVFSLQ